METGTMKKDKPQGLGAGVYSPPTLCHQAGLLTYTTYTGVGTRGENRTPDLGGEDRALSQPLAPWCGMEEDGSLSCLHLGTEGTHEKTTPSTSQPRRSLLDEMSRSNYHSKWRRDWPGPGHYKVRSKW